MDKVPEASATFCVTRHDGWERELIEDCYGSMRIRFELNADEQARVQESRKGESILV